MSDLKNTVLLLQQLIDEERPNEDILPMAKLLVQDLSVSGKGTSFIVEPGDYYENLGKRTRGEMQMKIIPTGFRDIDTRLYGAVEGEIMTICARTGVGKTTLGIDIALNMLENHKVGFITLEMTKEDMLDRIMSRECNIYLGVFSNNNFRERDIENLKKYGAKAKEKIDRLSLAYGCFNIEDTLATIEQMAEAGCEVVFIDWLGMIDAPGMKRNEQINYIMTRLKDMAITKRIAIIAMQQLNRQMDSIVRDEPEMYDIADGSAIEKISSPILILRKSKEEKTDETFVSIFKARRMNQEAKEQCMELAKAQGKKRQDVFFKIKLKDDLGHCSFRDYEYNPGF